MKFDLPQHTPRARRRKRLLSVICASAVTAILLLIGLVSAWNYFDFALHVPSPTSAISESTIQAAILSAAPSGRIAPGRIASGRVASGRVASSRIEWSFDTGEPIAASPVAHEGLVYVVAGRRIDTGRIVALDLDSGQPTWTYTLSGVSDFPPAVAGEMLYAVTRDGRVIALDLQNGQEKWTYNTQDLLLGTPAVRDGMLYAASDGLRALDALTGELLWTHQTEGGRTITPLAHSEGIVAVLSKGNHLNLIDAVKGKRRLTTGLWFGGIGAPVILEDTVVVTGDRGIVQAVDLHARDIPMEKALRFWWTKLWLYKSAPRPPDPVGYSWHHRGIGGLSADIVAAGDGRLFFIAKHADHSAEVVALDASGGHELWRFGKGVPISQGVALSGYYQIADTLIVGTQDGWLHGLDASSGEGVWSFSVDFSISAVSVTDENSILIASRDGVLHKVR